MQCGKEAAPVGRQPDVAVPNGQDSDIAMPQSVPIAELGFDAHQDRRGDEEGEDQAECRVKCESAHVELPCRLDLDHRRAGSRLSCGYL
eukprot:scaffold15782_cov58-Phaeocystis_antarctica.AAC.2